MSDAGPELLKALAQDIVDVSEDGVEGVQRIGHDAILARRRRTVSAVAQGYLLWLPLDLVAVVLRLALTLHGAPTYSHARGEQPMTTTYSVTATVDDLSSIAGVRHGLPEALELALAYQRLGYKDIRVEVEGVMYSLAQFRMLVE